MKSFKVDKELTVFPTDIYEPKSYPKGQDGVYLVDDGLTVFLVSVIQSDSSVSVGTTRNPPLITMMTMPKHVEVKEYYEVKHKEVSDLYKLLDGISNQLTDLAEYTDDQGPTNAAPTEVVSVDTMLKTIAVATNKKAAGRLL